MKAFLNKYWKYLLVFTLAGLIGTLLIGESLLDVYPPELQEEIFSQGIDKITIIIVTALQYAGYGLILGVLGIILAKNIGLWYDKLSIELKSTVFAMVVGIVAGSAMILFDALWFGKVVEAIADSYLVKPTALAVIGYMTLGGIVEEVMLRLFTMSLVVFLLNKIVKDCKNSEIIFVIANVISAILFAAGHLPLTQILFGLTPLVVFRCFLLNGGIGLLFGRLYRKYGIHYAMIAHAMCHLVSKLIWIIFI